MDIKTEKADPRLIPPSPEKALAIEPKKIRHQPDHYSVQKALEFKCTVCNKAFSKQNFLNMHMNLHTTKSNKIKSSVDVALELKRQKIEKRRQNQQQSNERHRIESIKNIEIKTAKETNDSKTAIRTIVINGKQTFKCPHCLKDFDKKGNCVAHIRIHTGEKTHRCEACDKSFLYKRTLSKHENRFHPDPNNLLKCVWCPKKFTSKAYYRNHISAHPDIKCSFCSKTFSTKNDHTYFRHIAQHTK